MEERKPWEQMEGESAKWFSRFDEFRLMKPWERSIVAVFLLEETEKNREKPRKKPTGDWYEVANQWKWEERADAYHKHRRSERDRQIAEKEADILDIPYAQKYERVKELDKKIRDLLKEADDEKRVWLPDVKSIQTGEDTYERVNLVHFNAPLFTVIDKYLAGIAAEMGERIKKKDIEVKGLPPNIYIGFDPNQDGTEL